MTHEPATPSTNPRLRLSSSSAGGSRRTSPKIAAGAFVVVVLCLVAFQLLPAATVAYDIVYVRAPRYGVEKGIQWADVFRPMFLEPGSDLVLLHPDGREEVLVSAGRGAVTDPCVSFDAQWVYYSYFSDPATLSGINNAPTTGADIYKINLNTRQVVRLTHQEYTPNTSVRTSSLPYGVFNMGPCPVSGGKIVFTSNRNGFVSPKPYTPVTSQLYVMDQDGSNVQPIAPMTLGAALHPFQLKDGRIAFSTQEAQGLRDQRVWALWAIWPDGRHWEPLLSAFIAGSAFHFATDLTGGDIVVEDYYNLNNMGFGTFHRFPTNLPNGAARFYPADRSRNPPVTYTNVNGGRGELRYPFSPLGLHTITPFTTMLDEAAAPVAPGQSTRVGKVTHPSSAPNGDLLLVWSPGPVNLLARPVSTPPPDAGLYIARGGGPVENYSDLVLIKNDPRYNELWPRAVLSYRQIYGVDEPTMYPFLPNDGSAHPALSEGTPYGIIGTSSLYKRESFPGWSTYQINYDGLETFNGPGEGLSPNWNTQGAEAGKYSNSDIFSMRILMMEPQTEMTDQGGRKFFNHVNERMRILGEIPVRKTNADGSPALDPEGNPDTSFWAKIPADTPVTFQMLDRDGRVLTMAQTWHQVRPGEVRTDCGGCHAHSQAPLRFETTAAARTAPVDLTLQPAHDVEYRRHIEPLIQRACIRCHRDPVDSSPSRLAFTSDPNVNYTRLANDPAAEFGLKPPTGAYQRWIIPNTSRYTRVLQSRRSLLMWKLYEARLDGWRNEDWPSGEEPHAQKYYMADLNYERGTVDHRPFLNDAERRMFAAWIDLAAPIDQGGGYWRDENRPTLTVKITGGSVLVGAADAYSGLDESSLEVKINGDDVRLTRRDTGIWQAPLPAAATEIVARVKDKAGNRNERVIRLSGAQPNRTRSSRSASTATTPVSAAPPPAANEETKPSAAVSTTRDGVPFVLDTFDGELEEPSALAFAPDGRLFVGERAGRVQIGNWNTADLGTGLILDDVYAEGDSGLLGLALDPDFVKNRYVYVYYTARAGGGRVSMRIARYREVRGQLAERAVILDDIPAIAEHDGGALRFGPDGLLYVATTEAGVPALSGDLGSLAGKVLRITRDGTLPRDNPYASPVYSYGHRYPHGLDWHPALHELWVVDSAVGRTSTTPSPLRVALRGSTYAVPKLLGGPPGRDSPVIETLADPSNIAFYSGRSFPQFINNLFIGTVRHGLIRAQIDQRSGRDLLNEEPLLNGSLGRIRNVVNGPDGAIYVTIESRASDGSVSRVARVARIVPPL